MYDIDQVCQEIDKFKPKLVALNGKTSTGKTTLSNALQKKYNCAVIELDTIIDELEGPAGANKYVEAYLKRDYIDFVNRFVESAQKKIGEALQSHAFVIIEGALANNETFQELISGWVDSFLFIYMEIKNIDEYVQRLTNRFEASSPDNRNSLPYLFWNKFTPEILGHYYTTREITPEVENAIKAYAIDSMKESDARLNRFTNQFEHIVKVEV